MKTVGPATRTIVVCLSRDRSPFSWFAYFTDGGGLTHASIAFDEDSDHYYSFNFKGFKREYRTSLKRRPREMKRYKIAVTEEQYQELKKAITEMEEHKGRYGYARLGVSLCLFKIPNPTGSKRFFCSQFVAKVLDESGCVHITRAYGNITPNMLGKELENSGKVTEITDDSTLRTFADIAVDRTVGGIERGKNIIVNFTSTQLLKARYQRRYVPPFLLRISIGTSDRCETVYRAAASIGRRTKRIVNFMPKGLAILTGDLINLTTGQLLRFLEYYKKE